jgi:topoisomerase-4 subunit A
VPTHADSIAPLLVSDIKKQQLVVISQAGHLLIFDLADLPILPKGKGNKIMQINPKELADGSDKMRFMLVLNKGEGLEIKTDKKSLKITAKELSEYAGKRAQRGKVLPKNIRENIVDITTL